MVLMSGWSRALVTLERPYMSDIVDRLRARCNDEKLNALHEDAAIHIESLRRNLRAALDQSAAAGTGSNEGWIANAHKAMGLSGGD